jgi:hypothetical protein
MIAVGGMIGEGVGTVRAANLLLELVVGEELDVVDVAKRAGRRSPSFSRGVES